MPKARASFQSQNHDLYQNLKSSFSENIIAKSWDADGFFSSSDKTDNDFDEFDVDLDINATQSPPTFATRFSPLCDTVSSETRFALPLRNRYLQQIFSAFGL